MNILDYSIWIVEAALAWSRLASIHLRIMMLLDQITILLFCVTFNLVLVVVVRKHFHRYFGASDLLFYRTPFIQNSNERRKWRTERSTLSESTFFTTQRFYLLLILKWTGASTWTIQLILYVDHIYKFIFFSKLAIIMAI